MASLRQSIEAFSEGGESEIDQIFDTLEEQSLTKGAFLLQAGEVCQHYYFVAEGSIRLYYLKDGNDYTVWIGSPGEIFTNLESYLDQSESRIYIEAIEQSLVYTIDKISSDQLAKDSNAYNTLLRKTVEIAFVNLSKNVISFQSDDANTRYQRVLNEKNWIYKYPLKYISTFIGVTQSSLSRIRSHKI
ncbi:MAG: cyclic nucleotide-binding domain-containing protein [Bacteroidota bacterium]